MRQSASPIRRSRRERRRTPVRPTGIRQPKAVGLPKAIAGAIRARAKGSLVSFGDDGALAPPSHGGAHAAQAFVQTACAFVLLSYKFSRLNGAAHSRSSSSSTTGKLRFRIIDETRINKPTQRVARCGASPLGQIVVLRDDWQAEGLRVTYQKDCHPRIVFHKGEKVIAERCLRLCFANRPILKRRASLDATCLRRRLHSRFPMVNCCPQPYFIFFDQYKSEVRLFL